VAEVEHAARMPRLLRVLAHHAAQLANYSEVGNKLGLSQPTARRYAEVLETLFVLHLLEPWHTNRLKRLVKTPKVQFYDSGLLAALLGANASRIAADRRLLGPLLEVFVFGEVAKLAALSPVPVSLYHYRDHTQNEVDLVAERQDGAVVGIEVKASATVDARDFAGLRKLRGACGDAFVAGVVLYDHERAVPFGDRLHALPLSALWA
jgi:hypothetical protein